MPPDHRVRWLVGHLVASASAQEQTDAAYRLVGTAPTLALRLDMLYEFSKGPGGLREPRLDLLDDAAYIRLSHELATEVQACDPETLAAETGVFGLLQLVHEALGQASIVQQGRESSGLQ